VSVTKLTKLYNITHSVQNRDAIVIDFFYKMVELLLDLTLQYATNSLLMTVTIYLISVNVWITSSSCRSIESLEFCGIVIKILLP